MEDKQRLQLGANPDWMSHLPDKLLDVPLWNLAIPGKTETLKTYSKQGVMTFNS